jgi:hypothetical protein
LSVAPAASAASKSIVLLRSGDYSAVGRYSDTDSLCFGCSGATTWQYTTNNGGSYTQINTETGQGNDGGWSVGHAPSPINIHD